MQGEAITSQGTAGTNMDGSEQRTVNGHREEREKDRAPQGHQVQGGGKKRKHEHTSEAERSSELKGVLPLAGGEGGRASKKSEM